jgi:hypothetical protein
MNDGEQMCHTASTTASGYEKTPTVMCCRSIKLIGVMD